MRGDNLSLSVNLVLSYQWWVEIIELQKYEKIHQYMHRYLLAPAYAAGYAVTETNPAGLNDITGDKAFVEQQESKTDVLPALTVEHEAGAGDNRRGKFPQHPLSRSRSRSCRSTIVPAAFQREGLGSAQRSAQQPEMPAHQRRAQQVRRLLD